jgi:hypothetical protein
MRLFLKKSPDGGQAAPAKNLQFDLCDFEKTVKVTHVPHGPIPCLVNLCAKFGDPRSIFQELSCRNESVHSPENQHCHI